MFKKRFERKQKYSNVGFVSQKLEEKKQLEHRDSNLVQDFLKMRRGINLKVMIIEAKCKVVL